MHVVQKAKLQSDLSEQYRSVLEEKIYIVACQRQKQALLQEMSHTCCTYLPLMQHTHAIPNTKLPHDNQSSIQELFLLPCMLAGLPQKKCCPHHLLQLLFALLFERSAPPSCWLPPLILKTVW